MATKANDPFLDETMDVSRLGDGDLDDVLDLSEVPDNVVYELWPAGTYDAVVDNVEAGRSQRSNNPMLTWHLKVRNSEGKERTFYYFTPLIDKGLPRVKRAIARIDPEYIMSSFKPSAAGDHFAGKPCQVKIKVSTYEGQRRNQVSDILAPREGMDDFLS